MHTIHIIILLHKKYNYARKYIYLNKSKICNSLIVQILWGEVYVVMVDMRALCFVCIFL